ncbi:hypothetical protein ACLMJK_002400 [Lecanora helva]
MASLLVAAGVISYDQIKKSTQKRRAKKVRDSPRFAELERENAARIAHLQGNTCFCQQSDWRGGGCEVHGYVPAAGQPGGPPAYMEVDERRGERLERRMSEPPRYEDGDRANAASRTDTSSRSPRAESRSPYQYRRGQEDGFLVDHDTRSRAAHSAIDLTESGRAPPPMPDNDVRRINEERRKRMKAGAFTNFVLRWKKDKPAKGGDVAVR